MCFRIQGLWVSSLKSIISSSPFYRGGVVLDEADHLLLHIYRFGLESKRHFVDQRLDAFAVAGAAQWLPLCEQTKRKEVTQTGDMMPHGLFVLKSLQLLTSAELRLLWDPDVLTIQWTYEESRPSTVMSTRCFWRAAIIKIYFISGFS